MLNISFKNKDCESAYDLWILLVNEKSKREKMLIELKENLSIIDKAQENTKAKIKIAIYEAEIEKSERIIRSCCYIMEQFDDFLDITDKIPLNELSKEKVFLLRDKDNGGLPTAHIIVTGNSTKEDIENAIKKMKSELDCYCEDDLEKYMPKDTTINFVNTDSEDEIWW